MLATYAGHAALVRGLVERGADPNSAKWLNDLVQAPIAGGVCKREDEVVRVFMEVEMAADRRVGEPNAMANARMFGCTDLLGVLGARRHFCGADGAIIKCIIRQHVGPRGCRIVLYPFVSF
ncbi:hypothetical protein DFH94DRAFT_772861 [Russula ochroleuca]|jgi:hypothetical protein|uniref:Ankyrin repeat protein n=1 Tax=Russula ochroleuca TaxID=152965 RepID=A0A9P5MM30_9AGAM|nr:hypothetical protein DFH94DRAFT_772861 [Russula ochroleuca]